MVTPRQVSENLELRPYKCYMCQGVIGLCTSSKLYVGAVIFIRSVTMECGYCGRHTFFKPEKEIINRGIQET